MPIIYLSPSTQEFNPYINGGDEEQYMNLIADAMIPYLEANGIRWERNIPEMTAASSIVASNAGQYDLHLALHSNAAPDELAGTLRGCLVFYYPGSSSGMRAADLMVKNLKTIYPLPELVKAMPTTSIGEVTRTRAPSVFLELGYHDNPDDAAWVKNNIQPIAKQIALALTEYFGIPFLEPQPRRPALVDTEGSPLNIRSRPNLRSSVLAKAPDGAYLTVINKWNSWYLVRYGCVIGYASSEYITLL